MHSVIVSMTWSCAVQVSSTKMKILVQDEHHLASHHNHQDPRLASPKDQFISTNVLLNSGR